MYRNTHISRDIKRYLIIVATLIVRRFIAHFHVRSSTFLYDAETNSTENRDLARRRNQIRRSNNWTCLFKWISGNGSYVFEISRDGPHIPRLYRPPNSAWDPDNKLSHRFSAGDADNASLYQALRRLPESRSLKFDMFDSWAGWHRARVVLGNEFTDGCKSVGECQPVLRIRKSTNLINVTMDRTILSSHLLKNIFFS